VLAAVEEAHLGEAPAEEAVEVRNGIGLVRILLLAGEITHTRLNISIYYYYYFNKSAEQQSENQKNE
jgi:hypothetical protein